MTTCIASREKSRDESIKWDKLESVSNVGLSIRGLTTPSLVFLIIEGDSLPLIFPLFLSLFSPSSTDRPIDRLTTRPVSPTTDGLGMKFHRCAISHGFLSFHPAEKRIRDASRSSEAQIEYQAFNWACRQPAAWRRTLKSDPPAETRISAKESVRKSAVTRWNVRASSARKFLAVADRSRSTEWTGKLEAVRHPIGNVRFPIIRIN